MNLIRIQKDTERAKSLYFLADLRYQKITVFDEEKETSLVVEAYYEVAKELITAILFCDGYKTLSHMDLISYLKTNYRETFSFLEIELLDQFRKYRNKIVYYGLNMDSSYLKLNKKEITSIIDKLFELCRKKTT